MGVDLSNYTQNKPYAVPFFQYLNRSAENVAINQTPGPEVRKTTKDRIIVLFGLLARSEGAGQALMNPERLEDAIYKNSPGIELYRKKVVQYLKQAVMERIATFPYNLDGTIQQATPRPIIQSENERLSCPMCDATFTSKCFLFDIL